MTELDIEGSFDFRDYRDGMKLLERTRETTALANKADFRCPACGDPFERLLISEKRANTFGDPGGRFCVVRTDDQLLLLSH